MDGRIELAQAVASTRARAVRVTSGDRVAGNEDVWVIQIEGVEPFACGGCSRPPGVPAQHGRFLTIVLNAKTFDSTDFGIGPDSVDLARLGEVVNLDE
jgi:hypothetical protein